MAFLPPVCFINVNKQKKTTLRILWFLLYFLFSYDKINEMERYLCLDIGDKRIGVAVSDPFNKYALPVSTYNRQNLKKDLQAISNIVKEKCATALVCGLPVNFDGTESIQTQKANFFIQKLKEELNIEVFTVDERCTTCEAEEVLISQGFSRQDRKLYVDSLAATSILESFLNEKNKNKN